MSQSQEQESTSEEEIYGPCLTDYGTIVEEDEETSFVVLTLEEQCAYIRALFAYLGTTFEELEAKHAERDMTGVEQHAWWWARDVHDLL